ncbi:hypothetical protein ACH5RR_040510 [Cinchona calisaya]|uniref:Zinc finger, CCHC-type n=1 Tax=Cinchona calisaya TaxID=153742 RepID=A0ABD2XWB1_9GENT
MKILLTTSHVAYVLTTKKPKEIEGETLEQTHARLKWDNDDFICMGRILNGMSEGLFDTYQDAISAKDLWERVEARYMQEDATKKEYRNQEDTKDNAQEGVHITENGKTKSHKKRSHHSSDSNKNKTANKKKKGFVGFRGEGREAAEKGWNCKYRRSNKNAISERGGISRRGWETEPYNLYKATAILLS